MAPGCLFMKANSGTINPTTRHTRNSKAVFFSNVSYLPVDFSHKSLLFNHFPEFIIFGYAKDDACGMYAFGNSPVCPG